LVTWLQLGEASTVLQPLATRMDGRRPEPSPSTFYESCGLPTVT